MVTRLLALALVALHAAPTAGDNASYVVRHADAECRARDKVLALRGATNLTVDECAMACADEVAPPCRYFIAGKSWKAGRCFAEYTASADCPEGWETDLYDFYESCPAGSCVRGCTEPLAPNYVPSATEDDGSCIEADTCARKAPDGKSCASCVPKPCDKGDHGWRNPVNDTIYAVRLPAGHVTLDGDLREWTYHPHAYVYSDLAFADADGREVVFEKHAGGRWFGPADFSVRAKLGWDEAHLYLALDVTCRQPVSHVARSRHAPASRGLPAAARRTLSSLPAASRSRHRTPLNLYIGT